MKIIICLIIALGQLTPPALAIDLSIAFTRNDQNHKQIDVGASAHIMGPIVLGVHGGTLNNVNIRAVSSHHLYAAGSIGADIQNSVLYGRITQGIALVQPGMLATILQFPTTAELGIVAGDSRFGVIFSHFSNGGRGQNGRVFDGFGLAFRHRF
jgi:hypothetical protein